MGNLPFHAQPSGTTRRQDRFLVFVGGKRSQNVVGRFLLIQERQRGWLDPSAAAAAPGSDALLPRLLCQGTNPTNWAIAGPKGKSQGGWGEGLRACKSLD